MITFAVGGSQRPETIAITASSDNARLVPAANIRIIPSDVSASNWQLIVEPAANQFGVVPNITLNAQDALNARGTKSFWLSVTEVNDPPSISLLSPTSFDQFAVPASIPLIAEVFDVDGSVASVEFWYRNLGSGASASIDVGTRSPSGNTWTYSWENVGAGQWEFWARAFDNLGSQADSTRVTVPVRSVPIPQLNLIQVLEGNFAGPRNIPVPFLKTPTNRVVTVRYSTADGTATEANGDYERASGEIILETNKVISAIPIKILSNSRLEPYRDFFINCQTTDPSMAHLLFTNRFIVKILDDDPPPRLLISNLDLRVDEGSGGTNQSVIALNLFPQSGYPVEVQFSTTNGTAVAGRDYTLLDERDDYVVFQPFQTQIVITNFDFIRFRPGQAPIQRPSVIIDNDRDEPDRTFFIDLTVATNYATLDSNQSRIRVTILDDDVPPSLSVRAADAVEGSPGATTNAIFIASLSAPSGRTVTAQYATDAGTASEGSDYRHASGTLTFQPGQTTTNIAVVVIGDDVPEPTENFFVTLNNPTNAVLLTDRAQGSIIDDEGPPVLFIRNASPIREGNSGTTNAIFQVALSRAHFAPVTVSFATTNGTAVAGIDYVGRTNTLTFIPGDPITTNVAIQVNGDVSYEIHETFSVNLFNAIGAMVDRSEATAVILDDDPPPVITIENFSDVEGTGTTNHFLIPVNLSAPSGLPVVVGYSTVPGTALASSDFVATNVGEVSFAPGETNQFIRVPIIGDTIDEADESFTVRLAERPLNAELAAREAVVVIRDDDEPPSVSIEDARVFEGNEGLTNVTLTVRLSAPSGQRVTVQFATSDQTAIAGTDYQPKSGTVTFEPGQTSQPVQLEVLPDVLDEDDETFLVVLSDPTNATMAAKAQAQVTIIDDDLPPTVSVENAVVTEGHSGTTSMTFRVLLSRESGKTASVDVRTADGTAAAASDYTTFSETIAFPPGQTSKTISVTVLGDVLDEADETFAVNLSNPVNATVDDAARQGTGTIVNDDLLPALAISGAEVDEGSQSSTNAVFVVTLTPASGRTVTVAFATADGAARAGTDYSALSDSLVFAAGITNRTITVAVNADTLNEETENFFVRLSNPRNATITETVGTGLIRDDDPAPTVSIGDTSANEGDSGAASLEFPVQLSAPSGQMVTVNFATANDTAVAGSDYFRTTDAVTLNPGQTNALIRVLVIGDRTNEPSEAFFVRLTGATNATVGGSEGRGTIINDDPLPSLAINDVSVLEGNAGAVDAVFLVSLSPASGQTVTVDFSTADGTALASSDYSAQTGTLRFAPGETSKTIAVPVRGDTLDEPNESFLVRLFNPSNATLSDDQGQAVIANDDPGPAVSIGNLAVAEGNEAPGNAVFLVSLSSASGRTLSVDFATADGTAAATTDYVSATGTQTFQPGETSKSVSVAIVPDTLNEADETFFVNLSNPQGASIAQRQGQATILNDDPVPFLSIADASITEGNGGPTKAALLVSLSAPSGRAVAVEYATTNGTATAFSDYLPDAGNLIFQPGETNQTIAIEIVADTTNEATEELSVQLSGALNAAMAKNFGRIRIADDDPLPALSIGDATVSEGDSGLNRALFNVSLSPSNGQRATVKFSTADDTASAAADYIAQSGTLIFEPGETNKAIAVFVNGDAALEPNETFLVLLSEPTNATLTNGRERGQATILDDDVEPTITINDISVIEGNAGPTDAVFTLSLSAASPRPITVEFATSAGTATRGRDYVETSGTVSFKPGETNRPITVTIVGDALDEPDESFFVSLSGPVNASIGQASARATIVDDDELPTVLITGQTIAEGDNGTTNLVFRVTLSAANGQRVSVGYSTTNGTASAFRDYLPNSGLLIFEAGETNKAITVEVVGDRVREGDEDFFINLLPPANARLENGQARGVIADDDPLPVLSIQDLSVTEGDLQPRAVFVEVTLSSPSEQEVKAEFATTDGTARAGIDFQTATGTVVFNPGETRKTIPVSILGDLFNGPQKALTLTLMGSVNATIAPGRGTATLTIVENDSAPSVSVSDAAVTEGNSGVVNAVLAVSLSQPSRQVVSVSWSTLDNTATAGLDYDAVTATTGSVTFNPGETNKPIVVAIKGDILPEAEETLFVVLSNPVNAVLNDDRGIITIADDDAPVSISISDASILEPDSGRANLRFTVSLSSASGQTVTVSYSTLDNTAHAGSDYVSVSDSLTFAPGTTSQTISVPVIGDLIDEDDESFWVSLSRPVNATLLDIRGTGTITNNDPPPTLSISDVSVTEGNNGTANAVFTVSLSSESARIVSFNFTTVEGTAQAGSDFQPRSDTLTILPGTLAITISVPVIGDTEAEASETFFVNLGAAANATVGHARGVGTIIDDDVLPTLSITDAAVSEGSTDTNFAVFTVRLSAPSSQTVAVDFQTADRTAVGGKDYTPVNGTLSFLAGAVTNTVRVPIVADAIKEPNEIFEVKLSNPVRARLGREVGIGTILDDEVLPTLSIVDAAVLEGNTGVTAAVFVVRLSTASAQTVTVGFQTSSGTADSVTDFQANSGTLEFPPGTVSRTVSVNVNGDTDLEPDETFFVDLAGPINASFARTRGMGTIWNDDSLPGISISDAAVTEGNSGTVNAVLAVSLSQSSSRTVTVNYATSDGTATAGSDYERIQNGVLIFNPGEISKPISVAIKGDILPEPAEETFFVLLSSPLNATILDDRATITISDDDVQPRLSISDASATETDSEAGTLRFVVSLSSPSAGLVTVDYATLDNTAQAGSDYASASGTLTFPPGSTNQTLNVQVLGDILDEDDESFLILLSNSSTNAVLLDNRAIGAIIDNDPPPILSISDASVTEGNGGTVHAVFTVTLNTASAKTVSVNVSTSEGTAGAGKDFQPVSASITIPPGTTSQTVSVPILGDTDNEPPESFSVQLSQPINATLGNPRGLGTIIDDDILPTLTITDASVREGDSGTNFAVFTVRLSVASSQTVAVDFKTADRTAAAGMDYVPVSGRLTLAPGSTTDTVRVPIIADTTKESDETFEVRLSNPAQARLGRDVGLGTILDDEVLPALTIADATLVEGDTGVTAANFVVRLSTASAQTVSVGFQTAGGSATPGADFRAASGILDFAPGAVSRTIAVEVNGDIAFEADETFVVSLANPVNALITDGQAVGTILNDDSPTNTPPAVRIINPPSGTAFTSPAEVPVTADAFDRDGSVRRVEFFVGSTLIGSATSPPFTVTWMNEAAGAYSLTAHAIDDQGAVAISEPANVLVSRRSAGVEVALVRNFPHPEISLIQNYLLEMGISSQVFEQEGLSFDALRDVKLVIWNDLGSDTDGLTDKEVAVFQQAFNAGIPLYFIGETLAVSARNLSPAQRTQWLNLIHLGPGTANRSDGTFVPDPSREHPVIVGRFGTVDRFNCSTNLEAKLQPEPNVTLLGKSGAADLILAYEPAGPEGLGRTVAQNVRLTGIAEAEGITEQKKLFKNVIAWLMRKSFQALTDLSVIFEGPLDPVLLGREFTYDLSVQHQGEIEGTGAAAVIFLAPGLKLVSASFVQGNLTEANGIVTYTLGNMASAQRSALSLVVQATIPGTLTTRVNVSGNEPDPNPLNNTTVLGTVVTGVLPSVTTLKPVRMDAQGFQLSVTGAAPGTYRVQVSANLVQWTVLTNFTGGGSPVVVTDPAASRLNLRYYRVVSP